MYCVVLIKVYVFMNDWIGPETFNTVEKQTYHSINMGLQGN